MAHYTIDPESSEVQVVGFLDTAAVRKLLGITFPNAEVRIYPGTIKHIKKRHPKVFDRYFPLIPGMIADPDYIGHNPKEPESIELYKMISDHLLIAIKLDPSGYLFLSSMYDLKNGPYKIKKRLRSGRIVPFAPTPPSSTVNQG